MRNSFICCFALFLITNIFAQQDSARNVKLEPVILKVSRIAEKDLKLPISISKIDFKNSQDSRQQLSLNEYLFELPGLFALNANNFSQDLRVSIRGFGARSAFGIRGVKILVDGIPETTPDGQGQIDNLNLAIIKDIEVIRGPSSTLYGNASGGVISINTLDSFDKNFIKGGLTFGSYNMQKYQVTAGIKKELTNYIFQGTSVKTDGYRQQSGFENYNFNFKMSSLLSKNSELSLQANYTDSPFAEDAGGLTLNEVNEDRRHARQRNVDFKTEETISQFKIGASLNHAWRALTFNTYGFYSSRNFFGLLPFEFGGIVDLSRNYFGNGSSLTFEKKFGDSKNTFQMGYDLAVQHDNRLRFRNMEGILGNMTLDQKESFSSLGIFALDHFSFGDFLIRAGMRYDNNLLKVRDKFLTDGNDSDKISLNSLNPSLGLNYSLNIQNHIFANFSTSFETPTLSELSANPTPEGGFNGDLKAQKARNYEVGYKLKNKMRRVSMALFYIETDNDLVPFELEAFPDRTFFRNAGSTSRKGLEFFYEQKAGKNVNLRASYTYSDFNYATYETPTGRFNDNKLPGIPKHRASASLNYNNTKGLTMRVQSQYIGSLYTDDSNAITDKGYVVVNVSFGLHLSTKNAVISPFLGINNAFDTTYNDNIRINAFGGRYFEPAPGLNLFGGIHLEL